MSKYKIINLGFFYVALLNITNFYGLSPASAKATFNIDVNQRTDIKIISVHDWQSLNERNLIESQDRYLSQKTNSKIVAAVPENNLANAAENREEAEDTNSIFIRIIASTFFILVVIPFGVFYPFFLFYKKLLNNIDREKFNYSSNDYKSNYTPAEEYNAPEQDLWATVSKLQMAFSPDADRLRQELTQIGSEVEENADSQIIDLVRETILVLIEQQHWTHASQSSITFPLKDIKLEFDIVSSAERKKFIDRELSSLDSDRQDYSYVVVTLILCTTHSTPLFEKIYTKEQLIEELIKLSKMPKGYLLKFELLWNPQHEDEYIDNDRLLTQYGDMIRLL